MEERANYDMTMEKDEKLRNNTLHSLSDEEKEWRQIFSDSSYSTIAVTTVRLVVELYSSL